MIIAEGSSITDSNSDPDEEIKQIPFSFADRDLMISLVLMDPDLEKLFRLAPVQGEGIVVPMNGYDLDALLGEITAVANHEKNKIRQRKFYGLFNKINDKLQTEFPAQLE